MKLFKKKKSKIPRGIKNISGFCYLGIGAIIFIYWLVLSPSIESDILRSYQLVFKSTSMLSFLSITLSIIGIAIILFIVGLQGQKIYELYLLIKSTNLLGENRFHTETAIEICKQQVGSFRNFCLLNIIDINAVDYYGYNKNFSLSVDYCEEIKNPRYYDKCQIKFLNCEKVKNDLHRDICKKAVAQLKNE